MIKCLRCDGPKEPVALVVEKPLGNTLCEKCGNSQYNILEEIKLYPPDYYELSEEEQQFSIDQQEAYEAGELTEVAPPVVDDTAVTFEEVDNMTVEELAILADKLKILIPNNIQIDELRDVIKNTLQL